SYIGKTVRQIERRTHEHGKALTTNNNDQSTTTSSQHTLNRPKRTTKPIERYGIDSNSPYQEQPKQQPNIQPKTSKSALAGYEICNATMLTPIEIDRDDCVPLAITNIELSFSLPLLPDAKYKPRSITN
ncbi:unnamed protein product, partial [Rotaria sp. Silwood2]